MRHVFAGKTRLRVPEPGKPIQAFVCAFKSSKYVRGPLAVGQRLERASGFMLGNDVASAMWECDTWPFQVYEVVVDPPDVFVGQGEFLVKTAAFRVVREVSIDEVYGPGAAKLDAVLADLHRIPWLAPTGLVDVAAVEEIVRELYARAAPYVKVSPAPVRIERKWIEACAADVDTSSSSDPRALGELTHWAREEAVLPEIRDRDLFVPVRTLRRVVFAQCYPPAWDAAWQIAYASFLRWSMKEDVPPGNAKAAQRTWKKLREKITSRRDDARRSAVQTARGMMGIDWKPGDDDADAPRPRTGAARVQAVLDGHRATGMNDVTLDAWNFSISAMTGVIDVMLATVADAERLPSHSLLDLFRMGLWPIGLVDGHFVVYAPDPPAPAR